MSSKLITDYRKEPMNSVVEVRRMLEDDPDNPDLLDWLAFVYYTNQMWDEAIEVYKKLLLQGFRVPQQRLYLGNVLYKKGLVSAAISEWQKVTEIEPDGSHGKKAKARLEEARAAESSTRPDGKGDR